MDSPLELPANARLALSYLASFDTGDPQLIAEHLSADFVNDHASALGSPSRGRDEYLRRLPEFLASMPGLRYEAGVPIVDGLRVAVQYTLHAMGTSVDGGQVPVTVRGVMLLRVEGGLIAERLDVWDSLGYLRQLGQT